MNPETKTQLNRMTTEELREANTYIVALIKGRRKAEAAMMRATLSVGDRVSWNSKKRGYTEGTVTKVNRTRADVLADGGGGGWVVPMNMLTKLQPDPARVAEDVMNAMMEPEAPTFNPETGAFE